MITHVAIIVDGKTYSLPYPNRHHHIIRVIVDETGEPVGENEQGFLDETGKFYSREDALKHALENNQVKNISDIRAGKLFSEDVW